MGDAGVTREFVYVDSVEVAVTMIATTRLTGARFNRYDTYLFKVAKDTLCLAVCEVCAFCECWDTGESYAIIVGEVGESLEY